MSDKQYQRLVRLLVAFFIAILLAVSVFSAVFSLRLSNQGQSINRNNQLLNELREQTKTGGLDGSPGAQGERGVEGMAGKDGKDGQTGSTGATGATGATGQTGPRGFPGASSRQIEPCYINQELNIIGKRYVGSVDCTPLDEGL